MIFFSCILITYCKIKYQLFF